MNSNVKNRWRQHVLRVRLPEAPSSPHEVDRGPFMQFELARQAAEKLATHLRREAVYAAEADAPAWAHALYEDLEAEGVARLDCFVQVWVAEPTVKRFDPIAAAYEDVTNPDAVNGYVLLYEIPVDPALPVSQVLEPAALGA